MTKFSVLICTYNRHEVLDKALSALILNTTEKPDQVVVVNGGDARTDQVIEKYQQISNIQVDLVRTVNKNLAVSRNIGLELCQGGIIAMTDDDAEVSPDWVMKMKELHKKYPDAGAIGGPVFALYPEFFISRLAEKVTFPYWKEPHYVRTLPTVNISYKAKICRSIGLQDETLWTGEDVDYNWRLLKAGYKILYDPNVGVKHNHPTKLLELWRKHYAYGRGYYLLRSKWLDMYCIYPHQVTTFRDFAKLIYFFVSIFSESFLAASSMERFTDKLFTIPVQIINHSLWRIGMVNQYFRHKRGVLGR